MSSRHQSKRTTPRIRKSKTPFKDCQLTLFPLKDYLLYTYLNETKRTLLSKRVNWHNIQWVKFVREGVKVSLRNKQDNSLTVTIYNAKKSEFLKASSNVGVKFDRIALTGERKIMGLRREMPSIAEEEENEEDEEEEDKVEAEEEQDEIYVLQ